MRNLPFILSTAAPFAATRTRVAVLTLAAALATVWSARAQQASGPAAAADRASSREAEAVELDKKVLAEAKERSEIMANLTYLSDVIGPRLTGSANLKRANEWAAEKMKSYGLTDVHQEAWEVPVGWERGTVSARLVEPDNGRSLAMASMGWSPGTDGKIVGDVVVLNAKNSTELKAYQGKLKGAIILRNPPAKVQPINDLSVRGLPGAAPAPSPTAAPRPPAPPAGPPKPEDKPADAAAPRPVQNPDARPDPNPSPRAERSRFGEWAAFNRELTEFLRTEGAAVLLSDAAKPQGLLVTTGGWRGNDRAAAPEPLPSLAVAHEHYALLYRLATRPVPARTRLEIEVSNRFVPGPIAVYNTVGEIKGSEKPDEFVVLGAHIDSWDLAQGTTDNGTGTAIVLEAARVLAKSGVKPRRTIRFCLFSGEEQGLYGSRAYVEKHKAEMDKTSMCLVHDTGTGKVTGIGLQGRAAIKPILEAELVSLKELGASDINLRSMGGSDHASFERAGVPGFAVQQDMSEYRFTHHTQTDTLDKVHEENLVQGAQVMAVAALRVANLDELLPRDKPQREGARRP
jgi:hypothetical protein